MADRVVGLSEIDLADVDAVTAAPAETYAGPVVVLETSDGKSATVAGTVEQWAAEVNRAKARGNR